MSRVCAFDCLMSHFLRYFHLRQYLIKKETIKHKIKSVNDIQNIIKRQHTSK